MAIHDINITFAEKIGYFTLNEDFILVE
jgi:hypothetical protein